MPRDIPHTVSPGVWTLAWRRLWRDRVAMVSLAIVALFLVQMILSGTGLVAKDWAKEVGVNYAPPSFQGPDTETAATTRPAATTGALTDATPRSRSSTLWAQPRRKTSASAARALPADPRSIGRVAPTATIVRRLWSDSRDARQTRVSPERT